MLYLIGQSLQRRKVLLYSSLFGIASGVAILFAVLLLYNGVQQGADIGEKRLGADLLIVPRTAQVEPETALFTGAPLNVYMPQAIREQVAQIPGIQETTPQFFSQTLSEVCCGLTEPTRLIGYDPQSEWVINAFLGSDGRAVASNPRTIYLGSGIINIIGNQINILGETFYIGGILPPTGTGLDASVLMPIDSVKRLAKNSPGLQQVWQANGSPDPLISTLLVRLAPEADRKQISAAIENLGPYQVVSSSDIFFNIKNHLDSLLTVVLLCGLLASAGALFQLFARLYAMVWDRKAEWGLYRSLGASKGHLFRLIAGESLALSLGGSLLGLLIGGLLYREILRYLLHRQAFPFLSPSWDTITQIAGGIALLFGLAGLLAAWLPAVRAAAIDPSTAMARTDID